MRGPSARTALPLLALAALGAGHGLVGQAAAQVPVALHAAGLPEATVVLADGHPVRLPAARRPTRAAAAPERRSLDHRAAPRPRTETVRRTERTAPRPTSAAAPAPRTAAAAVPGDSYPWAGDTSGGHDPWGFTKRQCVSYVAWRLDGAVSTADGWGSALDWDDTARAHGRTVSTQARVGAVAQWDAGEQSPFWDAQGRRGTFAAGGYGHVAWVLQVYDDGSALVGQYNGSGDRAYSTMRVAAPRYLLL